jgi:hypothetical protein
MKTTLNQEDYEYVMVWKHDNQTIQLPSPTPPKKNQKRSITLRVVAEILYRVSLLYSYF